MVDEFRLTLIPTENSSHLYYEGNQLRFSSNRVDVATNQELVISLDDSFYKGNLFINLLSLEINTFKNDLFSEKVIATSEYRYLPLIPKNFLKEYAENLYTHVKLQVNNKVVNACQGCACHLIHQHLFLTPCTAPWIEKNLVLKNNLIQIER